MDPGPGVVLPPINAAQDTDLGKTEVYGFFASGVVDDQDVKAGLRQLPAAHWSRETLTSIEYRNFFNRKDGETTLGLTTPGLPRRPGMPRRIQIFRHTRRGPQDRHEFLQTVYHEVGHHVHLSCITEDEWTEWTRLSGQRPRWDCVTNYATVSAEEDFAESYSFYITDADVLRAYSRRKYDFLRRIVFGGREYVSSPN
jgi:hypothetical protein